MNYLYVYVCMQRIVIIFVFPIWWFASGIISRSRSSTSTILIRQYRQNVCVSLYCRVLTIFMKLSIMPTYVFSVIVYSNKVNALARFSIFYVRIFVWQFYFVCASLFCLILLSIVCMYARARRTHTIATVCNTVYALCHLISYFILLYLIKAVTDHSQTNRQHQQQ